MYITTTVILVICLNTFQSIRNFWNCGNVILAETGSCAAGALTKFHKSTRAWVGDMAWGSWVADNCCLLCLIMDKISQITSIPKSCKVSLVKSGNISFFNAILNKCGCIGTSSISWDIEN